jgi:tetratricopeptide (TPR) repeat protein
MQRRAQGIVASRISIGGSTIQMSSDPASATKAVEACDAALASPLLLPAQILRRASLIRGRGIHRLVAGDTQAALADFALSDETAGSGEPLYRRSLGLGTQLLRAFAHHQAGRKDEAVAAARAAMAARPTHPETSLAAARIMLAATGDWDSYLGALRSLARYNPTAIQSLFGLAMVRGRFDEMLALQPHIVFAVPHTRDGSSGLSAELVGNFVSQIEIDGASAFALAALGRKAEAEAALAGIGRRIDEVLTEPTLPPGVTDRSTIRREVRRHRQFSLNEDRMRSRFAFWRKMTELRLLADTRPAEAATQAAAASLGANRLSLAIYEAIAAAHPDSRAEMAPRIEAARASVDATLASLATTNINQIADLLPEYENASRVSGYNGGSDGFFGTEGYMTRESAALPGARTVIFETDQGTAGTNWEMALLRAAELAVREGKSGLVVIDRRVLQKTLITTQYGREIDRDHEGFVAEVDVVFADPNALPAGLTTAGWRVLDAAEVVAQLAPVYRPAAAPANRRNRT